MATAVLMPRVGISVESCIITKWHKNKGDSVKAGELLFSYETDKATADEEAQEDGILLTLLAQEGDDVPVLSAVCVIGAPGEDISSFMMSGPSVGDAPPRAPHTEISALPEIPTIPASTESVSAKISPRAQELARRAGIDTRVLRGTGPESRVIERDVRAAMENGTGTGLGGRVTMAELESMPAVAAAISDKGGVEVFRLSSVRKAIAKAMTLSLSTIAQLTNNASFDATAILQYRTKLKGETDPALSGITINDIVLYAVAQTLKNHRELNAHLIGEDMHYYSAVHLGVAVDTPRGLLVPTLFNADSMSLAELSAAVKRLAKEAQAGTIAPDLLKGATFTVSNLGTLGVESFTPVINPPQTGILGVCSIVERVRAVDRGIQSYPAMGLSLTYDHRAIDGAPAARFLMELKELLENWKESAHA